MTQLLPEDCLKYILAPMVDQSDLPFRMLTRRHGVTLTYTQMWLSQRIVNDDAYRQAALDDLMGKDDPHSRPVVVQLAGNNAQTMLKAAKIFEPHCDAIDINLGCPQEHALKGHYGGYLLGRKDWPIIEDIVSTLVSELTIPVHVKIRLCNPEQDTPQLVVMLAKAGASVVAIHARHVSGTRRRAGPAKLSWVASSIKALEDAGLAGSTKVISNGNVRDLESCERNLTETGAAGLMIGEALLGNPRMLSPTAPQDPLSISLEYLALCRQYPVASAYTIRHHIKAFFAARQELERTAYFKTFTVKLEDCHVVGDFELLLESEAFRTAWQGLI